MYFHFGILGYGFSCAICNSEFDYIGGYDIFNWAIWKNRKIWRGEFHWRGSSIDVPYYSYRCVKNGKDVEFYSIGREKKNRLEKVA